MAAQGKSTLQRSSGVTGSLETQPAEARAIPEIDGGGGGSWSVLNAVKVLLSLSLLDGLGCEQVFCLLRGNVTVHS